MGRWIDGCMDWHMDEFVSMLLSNGINPLTDIATPIYSSVFSLLWPFSSLCLAMATVQVHNSDQPSKEKVLLMSGWGGVFKIRLSIQAETMDSLHIPNQWLNTEWYKGLMIWCRMPLEAVVLGLHYSLGPLPLTLLSLPFSFQSTDLHHRWKAFLAFCFLYLSQGLYPPNLFHF